MPPVRGTTATRSRWAKARILATSSVLRGRTIAAGIGPCVRVRFLPSEEQEQRGDVDDLSGATFDHVPAGAVSHVEGGRQIERDHRVPLISVAFHRLGQQADPGGVDQDVEAPEVLGAACDDLGRDAGDGQVG